MSSETNEFRSVLHERMIGCEMNSSRVPKRRVSSDELIIMQKGPFFKPEIWSPVKLVQSPVKSEPEHVAHQIQSPGRKIVSSHLRRRLTLSPVRKC